MGVTGLFSKLASIAHPIYFPPLTHHFIQTNTASSSSGNRMTNAPRVAIDISGWIAQSCHGLGAILLDERHLHNYGRVEMEQEDSKTRDMYRQEREGQLIEKVSQYVLRKVQLMRHLGMDVFVVLDGSVPPIKRKTSFERKRKRQEARKERDQVHPPSSLRVEATLEKETDVEDEEEDDDESVDSHSRNYARIRAAKKAGAHTSQLYSLITQQVLQEFKRAQIPFLVAPYEADGQLAYLSQKGYVDWIFSEDSDMIGHGVECLIYKLEELKSIQDKNKKQDHIETLESKTQDGKLARGLLIQRNEYGASPSTFSLQDFSNVMMAVMIVSAGCDYCSNLPGIGLVKARSIVQDEFLQMPGQDYGKKKPLLDRVLQRLYAESYVKAEKPSLEDYQVQFLYALVAFRHPVVFDPIIGQCIIKDLDQPDAELMTFKPYADILRNRFAVERIVGEVYAKEKAIAVAEGWINPKTDQLWVEEKEIPETLMGIVKQLVHRESASTPTPPRVIRSPLKTGDEEEEEEDMESQLETQYDGMNFTHGETRLQATPSQDSPDRLVATQQL